MWREGPVQFGAHVPTFSFNSKSDGRQEEAWRNGKFWKTSGMFNFVIFSHFPFFPLFSSRQNKENLSPLLPFFPENLPCFLLFPLVDMPCPMHKEEASKSRTSMLIVHIKFPKKGQRDWLYFFCCLCIYLISNLQIWHMTLHVNTNLYGQPYCVRMLGRLWTTHQMLQYVLAIWIYKLIIFLTTRAFGISG